MLKVDRVSSYAVLLGSFCQGRAVCAVLSHKDNFGVFQGCSQCCCPPPPTHTHTYPSIKLQTSGGAGCLLLFYSKSFVTIFCVVRPLLLAPPPSFNLAQGWGIAAGAGAVAAAVWLERECFSAGLSVLYSSKALALICSSLTCGGAGCRTAAEEIMRLQCPKPLLLLHQFPFLASSLTSPSHPKDSSAQPSGCPAILLISLLLLISPFSLRWADFLQGHCERFAELKLKILPCYTQAHIYWLKFRSLVLFISWWTWCFFCLSLFVSVTFKGNSQNIWLASYMHIQALFFIINMSLVFLNTLMCFHIFNHVLQPFDLFNIH